LIKTAVKLLIVAALLNALYRVGVVAWDYFRLRDEAEQVILFGNRMTTEELHRRIMTKAEELQVPIDPMDLDVRRDGNRTFVFGAYTEDVEFFPNVVYPVDLSFSVDNFAVEPLK
jgi:hypothetical protein